MSAPVSRDELRITVLAALATVAPEVDGSTLRDDAPVRAQVDIDSVDYLNFLIALHDATGVDIPETDYAQIVTLAGLVDYLLARVTTPP
ncbi:acyl carrier protein [Gemmatimonas sp.]|uniref:acyl carrier protein n=1 Tax=Gemmatimonas sp. TaxID=1962908 RepID=UPI0037BE7A79